jgi:cytochrome c oxidase subunit 2
MTVNTQRVLSAPLENPPADAIHVKAIGHQWWWEFEYQDSGFVTASDMVIPTGTTVIVEVTAADVIHAFWVPMLTGQISAIPGRTNHIWLKSEKDGTYAGVCNQFCGIQHALMRYAAISVPRPEFDAWVERQRMAPVTPVSSTNADQSLVLQAKGAQLFAAGACKTCHMIRGTEAIGKVGPDLTHFSSRTSIASKTLPSTVENVKAWLRNPQAVKPGTIMPNLNLKEEDIDALTAYLCRPVDPSINSGCQVAPANAAKK